MIVSALTCWAVVIFPAATMAEVSPSPSFCRQAVVHDYGAVFDQMAKLPKLPPSGHPTFFPRRTRIEASDDPILVPSDPGGTEFNFTFHSESFRKRSIALNWSVVLRLVQVNGSGRPLKQVSRHKSRIGTVSQAAFNALTLRSVLPHQEGLYRLTLVFKSQNGHLLGRYGQYLRILKPKVSAKLLIGPQMPNIGDIVYLQLVNTGTSHISYGEPFSIEEYSQSAWRPTEVELGPWHRILLGLDGGMAGRCQQFVLPDELAPGHYRLRKDVATSSISVTAAFEVLPAEAFRIP
jgi:hypothetical protein